VTSSRYLRLPADLLTVASEAVAGEEAEERRLRSEVKAAAKAFRRCPKAKKLARLLSFLSLSAELVPGLGTAVHGVALGTPSVWRSTGRRSRDG
jgi:hypothetical protein